MTFVSMDDPIALGLTARLASASTVLAPRAGCDRDGVATPL